MPIIARTGRRHWKVRLLVWGIYATLVTGAVTMVYPFLLMLAGSTKSAVDSPEWRIVPGFLTDERALYAKHVEGLFNESVTAMRATYDLDVPAFEKLEPPAPRRVASLEEPDATRRPNRQLVDEWHSFLEETDLPYYSYSVGYLSCPASRGTVPHFARAFRHELNKRYGGDIEALNREMGTQFAGWNAFHVRPESFLMRQNKPGATPFHRALREFEARRPVGYRCYFSVEGFFKAMFLKTQYTRDIADYNRAHGTGYASYDEIRLDRRLPAGAGRTEKERADWEQFVRTILNLFWIGADAEATPVYRRFLGAKYGDVAALNRSYGTSHASFGDAPLVREPPESGLPRSDWDAFIQGWKDPDTGELHVLPAEMMYVRSVEFLFRDHLRVRYGTVEKLNAAVGSSFKDWLDVRPPQRDAHYLAFEAEAGKLRREFLTRNYVTVADYMLLHGRGIVNTAIYCSLAILAALIVNPLAAYALSRYRPPSSYKVLLFLMLTMAFPPMVTQIPVFLMLRDLRLLNTFWALILPGLANGYSIFLLKGFFDSLPRELYESAEIDGAGEITIFWQITMSLSKPILAVIALGAFTQAYSNFMFALLTCQDQRMWTLMVWLYQLQSRSGPGVIYASLIVAAVPTFVVFALCQNVIMRGIVVPVEK